jgi:hypothetical protein
VLVEHLAGQSVAESPARSRRGGGRSCSRCAPESKGSSRFRPRTARTSVGEPAQGGRPHQVGGRLTMFIGCSVIITSMGASGEVMVSCDEDPMCMHTTTDSSLQARQTGSQCSEWIDGQPSFDGFSLNVSAWQPFWATRRISAAITSGSQMAGIAHGMKRPGDCRTTRRCASRCRPAPSPGRCPCPRCGRRADRRTAGTTGSQRPEDTVGAHVLDPFVVVVRAGPQLREGCRLDPVLSLGRPATALSATLPTVSPLYSHTLAPSSRVRNRACSRYFAATRPSKTSGGPRRGRRR